MSISAFFYLKTVTPIYTATALVLIEKPIKTSITDDNPRSISLQLYDEDYYRTQYSILKSRSLVSRVTSLIQAGKMGYFKSRSKDPTETLISLISVNPIRGSRLVEVSVDFPDPVIASKLANLLTSQYVEQNIENMLYMSKEMLKFLPDKLEDTPEKTPTPIGERLKELTKSENIKVYESLPAILNNPVLQTLKTEKLQIESELAQLTKRYKHKHPKIIELVSREKFINDKIRLETSKIIASIRAELAGKMQVNNIRIIDYAQIPKKPSKPKKLLFLSLAFGFSVATALIVIVLIELLSQTIKDSHSIEPLLHIPDFGIIPNIRKSIKEESLNSDNIFSLFDSSFDFNESLRMIRTNLNFALKKTNNNSILVTACLPNEGKSFVSLALASTLAKDGKKTLLADCDLRIGGLSRFILDNKDTVGLGDFLASEKITKKSILTKISDNVTLLPAGKSTNNPTEFFDTKRMINLFNTLRSEYDVVIVDSPPSLIITDAFVIGKIIQQVFFVIRYKTAPIDAIRKTVNRFNELNISVLGAVLNGVNISRRNNYYSYGKYHDLYKKSASKQS